MKLKCVHKEHIKLYTSCIYAESGEQQGRNKCKLLHRNKQNVNTLWGRTVRSCIKWNKNEQLNHSAQPVFISSEITEIPDTAVLHPMSYILHLSWHLVTLQYTQLNIRNYRENSWHHTIHKCTHWHTYWLYSTQIKVIRYLQTQKVMHNQKQGEKKFNVHLTTNFFSRSL